MKDLLNLQVSKLDQKRIVGCLSSVKQTVSKSLMSLPSSLRGHRYTVGCKADIVPVITFREKTVGK